MDQGKRKLAALLAAASLSALAAPAHAAVYVEPQSDAGQTLATAAVAPGTVGTSLTAIQGTFGSETDADLFQISISSLSQFSATTVNTFTNTGGQDTELSLFSSTGAPIALNDDANGTTTDSTLPKGNGLYANLPAGTYYIGITQSGNEAINSASQVLFTGLSQSGDTTAIRGAATGVNPATLSTFNGQNAGNGGGTGQYEIDFGIVTVPEPSTWAMIGLGALASGFAFLRRRQPAA